MTLKDLLDVIINCDKITVAILNKDGNEEALLNFGSVAALKQYDDMNDICSYQVARVAAIGYGEMYIRLWKD